MRFEFSNYHILGICPIDCNPTIPATPPSLPENPLSAPDSMGMIKWKGGKLLVAETGMR